jgi:hypothetical protein
MKFLSSFAQDLRPTLLPQSVTRRPSVFRLKGSSRRWLLAAATSLAVALFTAGLALAQTDPFVGIWKLDTAKSTPARKSETRIVESSPTGLKVSVDRTNADGSNQQFSYTTNLDGKIYPFVGTAPYGADSIGVTLESSNTLKFQLLRGGKVIGNGTLVVSADGKTATLKSKGTNEKGQTESSVSTYTKQ